MNWFFIGIYYPHLICIFFCFNCFCFYKCAISIHFLSIASVPAVDVWSTQTTETYKNKCFMCLHHFTGSFNTSFNRTVGAEGSRWKEGSSSFVRSDPFLRPREREMQEGRQVWFQRFVFELGLQDRADQCWKAKWVNRWVANCGPRPRRTRDRETAQQVQGTTRCCSATMGIQFTSAGSSWSFNAAPWLTEDKKTFEFGKRQEPDSAQREEPNSTWTQRKRSFNQDPHPGPWHTCNLMA